MKPLYGQGKGRVGVCMFNSVICCDVARQRRTRRSQLSHLSAGCCWLLQPRALLSSLRYPDREPSRLLAVIDKDGWLTPPGPPGHMMVTTGKVLLYSFRSVQGVVLAKSTDCLFFHCRTVWVLLCNLICIPSYLAWLTLFLPVYLSSPRLYWQIEEVLFSWMLSIVSCWSWSAGYTILESGESLDDVTSQEIT